MNVSGERNQEPLLDIDALLFFISMKNNNWNMNLNIIVFEMNLI